jgi:hypothetical protein
MFACSQPGGASHLIRQWQISIVVRLFLRQTNDLCSQQITSAAQVQLRKRSPGSNTVLSRYRHQTSKWAQTWIDKVRGPEFSRHPTTASIACRVANPISFPSRQAAIRRSQSTSSGSRSSRHRPGRARRSLQRTCPFHPCPRAKVSNESPSRVPKWRLTWVDWMRDASEPVMGVDLAPPLLAAFPALLLAGILKIGGGWGRFGSGCMMQVEFIL